MPRLRPIGLAPAATLRRPSWTIAWASTVAVVVPSPATSLVLVATSLASWAPRFSNGSSSSISRAMVTPSLVMVGAPHFLSRTTLRPLGPSVTLTALASASTPRSSARRASSSNSRILAMCLRPSMRRSRAGGDDRRPGRRRARRTGARRRLRGCYFSTTARTSRAERIEVLLAGVLDLGAAVLAVDDLVADGDVERDAVAVVVDAARADREDLALLGLLLGGVRDDQAGRRGLLGLERLDDDAVLERLDGNRHGVLTSPFGMSRKWTGTGAPGPLRRRGGRLDPGVRWHSSGESANEANLGRR